MRGWAGLIVLAATMVAVLILSATWNNEAVIFAVAVAVAGAGVSALLNATSPECPPGFHDWRIVALMRRPHPGYFVELDKCRRCGAERKRTVVVR
jgi:hypothetical protein